MCRKVSAEPCCGDGRCDLNREDENCCHEDCNSDEETSIPDRGEMPKKVSQASRPNHPVFGELSQVVHDQYHCQELYKHSGPNPCSSRESAHRASAWLDSLLTRHKAGSLPFHLPSHAVAPGAFALDVGCGLGQDSRNMATAGFATVGVDVAPDAIEQAWHATPDALRGTGAGEVHFIAYDALALPPPARSLDLVFDGTVYCALRHRYLPRLYALWRRLLKPQHTLLVLNCWHACTLEHTHARTRAQMHARTQ